MKQKLFHIDDEIEETLILIAHQLRIPQREILHQAIMLFAKDKKISGTEDLIKEYLIKRKSIMIGRPRITI